MQVLRYFSWNIKLKLHIMLPLSNIFLPELGRGWKTTTVLLDVGCCWEGGRICCTFPPLWHLHEEASSKANKVGPDSKRPDNRKGRLGSWEHTKRERRRKKSWKKTACVSGSRCVERPRRRPHRHYSFDTAESRGGVDERLGRTMTLVAEQPIE